MTKGEAAAATRGRGGQARGAGTAAGGRGHAHGRPRATCRPRPEPAGRPHSHRPRPPLPSPSGSHCEPTVQPRPPRAVWTRPSPASPASVAAAPWLPPCRGPAESWGDQRGSPRSPWNFCVPTISKDPGKDPVLPLLGAVSRSKNSGPLSTLLEGPG